MKTKTNNLWIMKWTKSFLSHLQIKNLMLPLFILAALGATQNTTAQTVADCGAFTSQSGVSKKTSNSGYTGSGYADMGVFETWFEINNVNVSSAGGYKMAIRYSNGDPNQVPRKAIITINGVEYDEVSLNPTNKSWTTWVEVYIPIVNLNAGNNTVRMTVSSSDGANIDKFTFYALADDHTAPSTPDGLAATELSQSSFLLLWNPSTDNMGIASYEIFSNGISKGTSPTTSYRVTGLSPTTTYSITVKAKDGNGNVSGTSSALSVTTTIADLVAPTAPSNIDAYSIDYKSLIVRWSAGKDNIAVDKYEVFLNGVSKGFTKGFNLEVKGLTPSTYYTITVKAYDEAGNKSVASESLTVKTTATSAYKGPMKQARVGVNLGQRAYYSGDEIIYKSGANPGSDMDGSIWNPAFIDDLKEFSFVRPMDWLKINHSSLSSWTSRASKTSSDPIAYEHCISLANKANVDLWLMIPAPAIAASSPALNDFSLKLAILVKHGVDMKNVNVAALTNLSTKTAADFIAAGGTQTTQPLNSNLKVYLEYSNETWNGQFTQASYCITEGNKKSFKVLNNTLSPGQRYSVWASMKMFESFAAVFGSAMSTRVVKMICAQGNNDWATNNIYIPALTDPLVNPNNTTIDAFSISNYFCKVEGSPSDPLTIEELILAATQEKYTSMKIAPNLALKNIPLIAYEGGVHWTLGKAPAWDKTIEMYSAYKAMLHGVAPYFNGLAQYILTGKGQWGSKQFTGQSLADAHKYRALIEFNDTVENHYVPDVVKPNTPPKVRVTKETSSEIDFTFSSSVDDRYLKFYKIYLNNTVVQYKNFNDFDVVVGGLTPSTTYNFKVTAIDAEGNESAPALFTATTREALPDLYVKEISTPITLDGNKDAVWNSVKAVSMSNVLINKIPDYDVLPLDMSGTFRMAYDATKLYFYGEIFDDVSVNNQTSANCTEPWNDDCMELYLDMGNEKATTYDHNDDQFAITMNPAATFTCMNNDFATPLYKSKYYPKVLATDTAKYVIEGSFAWSNLQKTPAEGLKFGLEVHYNDDDNDNVNGTYRDKKMGWYGTADVATSDPSKFGTAQLSKTLSGALDFSVSRTIITALPNEMISSENTTLSMVAFKSGDNVIVKFISPVQDTYSVSVYNIAGSKLYSSAEKLFNEENTIQIPINSLGNGMHLIRITNNKGIAGTAKIVL